MNIRIPFDDEYVRLVGTAIYVFLYYEWRVIYLIETLSSGFVAQYSRGRPLPSGRVAEKLKELLDARRDLTVPDLNELRRCSTDFSALVPLRNALIHAHPITDQADGAQILNYQGRRATHQISDMKWTNEEIETLIRDIATANARAGKLFERLKPGGDR